VSRITEPARLARACAETSGWLLPYLSTANTARDLDVIRQSLGDERLTYLGFSYGSTLGAVYAHEFPTRVGRMALDGVPDPTLDDVGTALAQTKAFQRALDRFAADCAAHHCPVPGRTGAQVVAAVTAGAQRVTRAPLATGRGHLDRAGYLQALENALYSKDIWPSLRQALGDLRAGNGELMMELARPGGGLGRAARDWGDEPQAGQEVAQLAIHCRDTPERRTPAGLRALDARFGAASPLFGPAIEATLLACTGWPQHGADTRNVAAPTAPRTLLVSTTGDPATPYEGARHMARALGNGSRVLTYRGDGHGAYFAHDACVTRTVNAYLVQGKLPAAGAAC
jgi:pimeloyl-ACP methyl ester carboxylesterase